MGCGICLSIEGLLDGLVSVSLRRIDGVRPTALGGHFLNHDVVVKVLEAAVASPDALPSRQKVLSIAPPSQAGSLRDIGGVLRDVHHCTQSGAARRQGTATASVAVRSTGFAETELRSTSTRPCWGGWHVRR